MSAEMVWFVGAPVAVVGLVFGAVRLRQPKGTAPARAADDDELSLTLAPTVRGDGAPRSEAEPAAETRVVEFGVDAAGGAEVGSVPAGEVVLQRPTVVARLRRGVQSIVRRRSAEPADELEARPDVLSALHAERLADPEMTVEPSTDEVVQVVSPAAVTDANGGGTGTMDRVRDNVTPLFPITGGHGIVELEEPEMPPDAQRPIAGVEWAEAVSAREVSLRATLEARDAAAAEDLQRQAEADAARHQQDLERIAVAEEARVRAEARARRWFVRLDADLDAPTIAQRMTLVGTLGIRAPWAGKLLREAFAQEEEARVRARIIGALVAGDHLDVTGPFERAFAAGGLERGAVWEALRPRSVDAPWIAPLLAPLQEAMTAA